MVCLCKINNCLWLSRSHLTIVMFLVSGVAKVQVVADENTDPKSLHLSNCCVESTAFGYFLFFSVYTELLIFLKDTLLDLVFCFEGLEEISAVKESLSKQRKAAAIAAEESRKTLKNEDKDYEPKPTPGCLLTLIIYLLLSFSSQQNSKWFLFQNQTVTKISVNQQRAKMRNSP